MKETHFFVACLKNGTLLAGGTVGEPNQSMFHEATFFHCWKNEGKSPERDSSRESLLYLIKNQSFDKGDKNGI